MPFCNSCGKEIPATTRFCPYCGSEVRTPEMQPGSPPPQFMPPPPAGQYYSPPQSMYQPVRPVREKSSSPPVIGALGLASMILVIIGSFLPWISVFGYSKSGWEGDGKITVVAAIITALFFIVALAARAKWPYIISLLVSLVTAAIFVMDIVDIIDSVGASYISYGLYIGTGGACIAIVFSILGLTVRQRKEG